ncbi:MAG: T9SS type A sorting domain-containing protein [Ignavibacteriales bacterium]|nr:MAG: T9SS type A sorting domain-containing protein [Ignavibacteriales bacterium]
MNRVFTSLKFIKLIVMSLMFLTTEIIPQTVDSIWTKTFGGTNIDIGHSVEQTSDGGYIITGYTRSFGTMSGRNLWLIKTDENGNQIWNNALGGNSDDEGHCVKQSNDGGYIIAGLTNSFGAGVKDVYLVKTDSLGSLQWQKTFGGNSDDEGYSVIQSSDDGFVIAGVTSSFTSGGRDLYLVKTDVAGNLVWQKNLGGLSSDGAWEIQNTSDNGFIIAGWTFSQGPGALGNAWLVKTDSAGNEQWNKYFGGADVDRAYSVQQTVDNGYILTGYTSSFGAGLDDMLLIKTDSIGNQSWMKTFGGTGRDYGYSIDVTSDSGFIIAGYTLSFGAGGDDLWLVKTDYAGNQMWSKTFGGTSSEIAYSVIETIDGSFVVTGHTLSYGAGVHDVWLLKISESIPVELINFSAEVRNDVIFLNWSTASEENNYGFIIERRKVNSFSGDDGTTNQNNDWIEMGFVEGTGNSTQVVDYSFRDKNIFNGTYQYRLKQIDYNGSFQYSGIIEIDYHKLIQSFELEQNYPNPFNPSTTIKFALPKDAVVTLKVYDALGAEVTTIVNQQLEAGYYKYDWNASGYAGGMYIYRLQAGEFTSVKKMVILK